MRTSPGSWLLAFAVAAVGKPVAKPARPALVAIMPRQSDLVPCTPTRVVVMPGCMLRRCRIARWCLALAIAARRALRRVHCCGDLLVQGVLGGRRRGGWCGRLGRLLRRLLARVGVRFARGHHLGQPGEDLRHAVLEVLVIGITRRVHELHAADPELHVHRGRRFAGGPAGGAPRRGWGLATRQAPRARATRTRRPRRGRSWLRLYAGVRRWWGGV